LPPCFDALLAGRVVWTPVPAASGSLYVPPERALPAHGDPQARVEPQLPGASRSAAASERGGRRRAGESDLLTGPLAGEKTINIENFETEK